MANLGQLLVGLFSVFVLGTFAHAGTLPPDSDSDGISDVDELRPIQAVSFGPMRVIAQGEPYWIPESVDFDGDGDSDVLVTTFGEIFWFENGGSGTSWSRETISTFRVSQAVGADLDGDGDIDVFTATLAGADPNGPVVGVWVENLGEGAGFASPVTLTEARRFNSKALGNLDGDQNLDLVLTSADGGVFLFKNLGGGAGFASSIDLGGSADSLLLRDLDGDGDLDILAGSSGPFGLGVFWYENLDGEGSFGSATLIGEVDETFVSGTVADLNGDGHADVIVNGGWYPGPPQEGSFGTLQPLPRSYTQIYAADLDLDGDLDLISQWEDDLPGSDPTLVWFENLDGQGRFGEHRTIASFPDWSWAHLADVDGDGDMDIVAGYRQSNLLAWYRNESVGPTDPFEPDSDGDGLLDGEELEEHNTDPNQPDSDGDGLMDGFEVAAGFDPRRPGEHAGDADSDGISNLGEQTGGTDPLLRDTDRDGLFDGAERSRLRALGFGPARLVAVVGSIAAQELVVADVDGDGDADLLLGTDGAEWYENVDGRGSFNVVDPGGASAAPMQVADLNGDGYPDRVVWGSRWRENLGSGFGALQPISADAGAGFISSSIADFDGDGDLDVVGLHFAGASASALEWYENLDGLGTFGLGILMVDPVFGSSGANGVGPLVVADITGNGLGDVLYEGTNAGITWYETASNAGPSAPHILGTSWAAYSSFAAADFDGDLDLDVAAIRNGIHLFVNPDGLGKFDAGRMISPEPVRRIAAFDLDGDGDPDLLSQSSDRDAALAWWENVESGTGFERHGIFDAMDVDAVTAGDLDGDGDLDLVTYRYSGGSGTIEWYANPGSDPLDATSVPEPSRERLGIGVLFALSGLRWRSFRRRRG